MNFSDEERDLEIEAINNTIRKFVKSKPYPSAETMKHRIVKGMAHTEYVKQALDLNDKNYQLCERFYNNCVEEPIIKEIGKKMNEIGGIEGMRTLFYTLRLASPLVESQDPEIFQGVASSIEYYWNGIGQWLA